MKFDYFNDFYNKFYEGIHIKDELIVKQIFDYNFSSFVLKEENGKNILEDESPNGWLKYELNIYPDENLDKALFIYNLDTKTFDDSIPAAKFANDMMFMKFGRMDKASGVFTKMYIVNDDIFIETFSTEIDPVTTIEVYKDTVNYLNGECHLDELNYKGFNGFKKFLEDNKIVPDAKVYVNRFKDDDKKDIYAITPVVNGIEISRYEKPQLYGSRGGYNQYMHSTIYAHECYKNIIEPLLNMEKDNKFIETAKRNR